jgi:hypothetical protein
VAFTTITVTRTYKTPAGYPAQGVVRFTPSSPMVNGTTTIAAPEWAALNKNGALSIVLAANNDPSTTPAGTTYRVQETLTGQDTRIYDVVIPYNAVAGTVDLSTLAPVVATAPAVQYVSSVNGQSGAVTVAAATDATTLAKGISKILGGTADVPTVPFASVTGVPTYQPLSTLLTRMAAAAVTVTYAASITPDASQSCVFDVTATGNLTLADISNGIDGQTVNVRVVASGGTRILTITGVYPVTLSSGARWSGWFRYDGASGWALAS